MQTLENKKSFPDFRASYAVTVSPNPTFWRDSQGSDVQDRAIHLMNQLAGMLFPIRKHITLNGVFELGATKSLHTHFKLTFLTERAMVTFDKSIRYKINHNIGYISLKTGNIDSGWDKYMQKEQQYMGLMGIYPYTDEALVPHWGYLGTLKIPKRKPKYKEIPHTLGRPISSYFGCLPTGGDTPSSEHTPGTSSTD